MYTLHYAPGSCSMLINMLLEELAVPFEAVRVDFGRGDHRRPAFLAINAKGKVPALVTPEGVITECMAIAEMLCDRHGGEAFLGKPGSAARAKTVEEMATLATEIHPLFNRFFHESDFSADPAVQAAVKAHGTTKLLAWFREQDAALTGEYWSGGDSPTLADHYFAVIARWGRWLDPPATRMKNIEPFLNRIAARPAVARALAREGNTLFS
jgi:glutathione S-transferase